MVILSGFMPIPLAMMIPFMGAQSLVLGKQFGEGFQYGKRKISAMSNEEFNAITPAKLAQNNAEELKQMIPSMQQSITDMRGFQSFIVKELIATIKQLPGDVFTGLTEGQDPNAHFQNNPFGSKDLADAIKGIFDKGIQLNLGGLGNLLPQAFADAPPPDRDRDRDRDDGDIGPPNIGELTSAEEIKLQAFLKGLTDALFKSQYRAYLRGTPTDKGRIIYKREQQRRFPTEIGPDTKIIQSELGKTSLILQTKMLKYALLFNNGRKNVINWRNLPDSVGLRANIVLLLKKMETYRQIFNLALQQSRNYSDLTPTWGDVKPLVQFR